MVIKTPDTTELRAVLRDASQRFRALGDRPIWSSYRDGIEIADFIDRSIEEIRLGTIPQSSANELWGIFAPTCDWDDCVGECELGQKAFDLIERDLGYDRDAGFGGTSR